MLPNFLIIGAQKSGSTFFLKCLSDHPDVFMPPGEVRFFEDPQYLRSTLADLERLFDGVTHETALGIKRPGYLSRPECAERIHRHVPDAKLIVILRNPVQRALSAYYHLMRCGFIPVRPVEEGLTRILDGTYQTRHPKAAEIIEFGLYAKHLTRYLRFFDRGQFLILLFDAISADPLGSVRQAYRCVGVREDYVPAPLAKRGKHNPNPGVYSLARLKVLNLRNPLMFEYNHDMTRRYPRRRPGLMNRAASKLILAADRYVVSRIVPTAKPELSPALRARLYGVFREDVLQLEDLLGQRLPAWKNGAH